MSVVSNPSSNIALSPTATANKLLTPNPIQSNSPFLGNSQNLPSNNTSYSSLTPNKLLPLTPNKLLTPNPIQSNSPFLGNSQNLPSNNTLVSGKHISTVDISSQTPSNDSVLSNLYNLTANSVVEITAFNIKNHSIFKTGSGFIYNSNGTSSIITASNLVVGDNDITVTLPDGSSYDSKLIGYDPLTTIAVLSTQNISQTKLVPLSLANSTDLKVGQIVTTIGNTMGFTNLYTTGIINGLGKSVPSFGQNISISTAKIPNSITTNLNLGTGYGGSPLLDNKGQVIGMNIGNYSSTISQSKNTGISYAVPSNSVSKIISSLLSKGFYSHPWLGAYGVDVDLDIAKALNLTDSKGFLVIAVANSSPAKKAGIMGGDNTTSINGRKITLGGDIILKVDNKYIQNIQDMSGYIEGKKNIGDSIKVTLLRNGVLQLINVRLEANPNYFLPLK
ncbi:MAG: trypsin-like peptidase domain-containing protein [Candidatus Nitrosocosmicus sp.]